MTNVLILTTDFNTLVGTPAARDHYRATWWFICCPSTGMYNKQDSGRVGTLVSPSVIVPNVTTRIKGHYTNCTCLLYGTDAQNCW